MHQPDNWLTGQGKNGSRNHIVGSDPDPTIFCGNFLQTDTGEIVKSEHCSAIYREGTVVTLQAVADTANGYQFEGWGGACTGVDSCVFLMTANQSVIATFSRIKKTIFYLKMDKIGKGTVNTTLAAHCYSRSNSCSAPVQRGSWVTLTAAPDAGYHFTGWGEACAGSHICTVHIRGDQAVMATFTENTADFTLHVNTTGQGIVTSAPSGIHCGVVCTAAWPQGTHVVLKPLPLEGHIFSGWQGNCSGLGPCAVTMHGDRYVQALFTQQPEVASGCASRDFTLAQERVLGAYIAYYGRPPDAAGLAWWSDEMHRKGGNIETIISAFGQGREYTDRFGSMNNRELVNNLYQQLYGRNAEPEGLDWYTGQLSTHQSTLASIAIEIHDGARGSDAAQLENRKKVARHYVTVVEKHPFPGWDADALASLLARVDADNTHTNAICEMLTAQIR